MDHAQAEQFFIKRESYCNFELPPYFCFEKVLEKVSKVLNGKQLKSYYASNDSPSNYDDVNHTLLANKDGKYAWRPFTLIHPALYYALVNLLTSEEKLECSEETLSPFSKQRAHSMSQLASNLAWQKVR